MIVLLVWYPVGVWLSLPSVGLVRCLACCGESPLLGGGGHIEPVSVVLVGEPVPLVVVIDI